MKTYNFTSAQRENIEETVNEVFEYYRRNDVHYFSKLSLPKMELFQLKVKLIEYQNEVNQKNSTMYEYTWVVDTIRNLKNYSEVKEETERVKKELLPYEGYPDMDKETEIALLEKLCASNSYFADTFREHFETMKNNILNDLPITLGIEI